MQFEVAAPSRGEPVRIAPTTQVILQQDRWDDFGFKTQYHLYYFEGDTGTFVGNVKILKLGQDISGASLLQVGRLAPLGPDFCSIGASLDYYQRLSELPIEVRDEILVFLRDGIANPEHAAAFESEAGWSVSVMRDLDAERHETLARTLLDGNFALLPHVNLALQFQMNGWEVPLVLNFDAPDSAISWTGMATSALPDRIAVLTGRNASGKSTLLARLARILHATPSDRNLLLRRLGTIEPAAVGFTRIIAISYSAFDTFQVPGVSVEEKKQIIADLRSGSGRYIFAGLRDIASELERKLATSGIAEPPADSARDSIVDEVEDLFALDREEDTRLKSADELADEYAHLIDRIFAAGRTDLLHQVLSMLLADPSFSDGNDRTPSEFLTMPARAAFKSWSTGHKIVMHMLATLVARTEPKSIVLLDEPESHLHPPLLAALMHAVRHVLSKQDAFGVVATHSPVVAQETLGRHVSVISRVADTITILSPKIETYGESIGEITDEVFGLSANATDFHNVLRGFVEARLTLEQIEAKFDRGLSFQARAFVMSLLASQVEA